MSLPNPKTVEVGYRVVEAIPAAGAEPGDYLVVRPGNRRSKLYLYRDVPEKLIPRLVRSDAVTVAFTRPEYVKPFATRLVRSEFPPGAGGLELLEGDEPENEGK